MITLPQINRSQSFQIYKKPELRAIQTAYDLMLTGLKGLNC